MYEFSILLFSLSILAGMAFRSDLVLLAERRYLFPGRKFSNFNFSDTLSYRVYLARSALTRKERLFATVYFYNDVARYLFFLVAVVFWALRH